MLNNCSNIVHLLNIQWWKMLRLFVAKAKVNTENVQKKQQLVTFVKKGLISCLL
jgi:hypothetical protein